MHRRGDGFDPRVRLFPCENPHTKGRERPAHFELVDDNIRLSPRRRMKERRGWQKKKEKKKKRMPCGLNGTFHSFVLLQMFLILTYQEAGVSTRIMNI
jgi:hypothetical protein